MVEDIQIQQVGNISPVILPVQILRKRIAGSIMCTEKLEFIQFPINCLNSCSTRTAHLVAPVKGGIHQKMNVR